MTENIKLLKSKIEECQNNIAKNVGSYNEIVNNIKNLEIQRDTIKLKLSTLQGSLEAYLEMKNSFDKKDEDKSSDNSLSDEIKK